MARPPFKCLKCRGQGKYLLFKGEDSNGFPLFENVKCDWCTTHS